MIQGIVDYVRELDELRLERLKGGERGVSS